MDVRTDREDILNTLSQTKFLSHRDLAFFHGRLLAPPPGAPPPPAPAVSWACEWKPRTDSECEDQPWLTASEFTDQPDTLRVKARQLAVSTSTVIYSGAGISPAAGIAPAARSSCN